MGTMQAMLGQIAEQRKLLAKQMADLDLVENAVRKAMNGEAPVAKAKARPAFATKAAPAKEDKRKSGLDKAVLKFLGGEEMFTANIVLGLAEKPPAGVKLRGNEERRYNTLYPRVHAALTRLKTSGEVKARREGNAVVWAAA